MAKVLYDNDDKGNPTAIVIILDPKEKGPMIQVLAAAQTGKILHKSTKAFKLAEDIEGKFPL